MKSKSLYVKGASRWNFIVSKFLKTKKRIETLEKNAEGNLTLIKILVEKLKKLYHKLESLQNKVGFKLAGSALALLLISTSVNAQEFVPGGYIKGDPIVSSGKTTPVFSDISGGRKFIMGTSDGYVVYHRVYYGTEVIYKEDTLKIGGTNLDVGNVAAPAFGDVDNDEDIDLVVGDNWGYIRYLEKLPSGYQDNGALQADGSDIQVDFTSKPAFADLDGDGDDDLYVGDYYGSIDVFINDGSGTFTSSGTLQADGAELNVGYMAAPTFVDLDDDGDLDLVVGEYYGKIFFYENDGSANFTAIDTIITGNYYSAPTFFDIGDDGDNDMIVGFMSGDVKIYRNDNGQFVDAGLFLSTDRTNGTYSFPTLFDFNGDDKLDIIAGSSRRAINVFINQGDSTFFQSADVLDTLGNTLDIGQTGALVQFFDKDDDGDYDFYTGTEGGYIFYVENKGNNSFVVTDTLMIDGSVFDVDYYSAPALGDIDNDGDLDMFVGNGYGYIRMLINQGNYIFADSGNIDVDGTVLKLSYCSIPALVDIDGDGDLDLLVGNSYGYVYGFLNDGSGNFTSLGTLEDANGSDILVPSYSSPAMADVDDNGTPDLIIGNEDGLFKVYFNNDTIAPVPQVTDLPDIIGECSVSIDSADFPLATDNYSGEIVATTDSALTYTEQGNYVVIWKYTDNFGNIAMQEQNVIVADTTKPELICVSDTTVLADATNTYTITGNLFDATATDNCTLDTIFNSLTASATLDGQVLAEDSTYTITWVAIDETGNTDTCTFEITVEPYGSDLAELDNDVQVFPNPATSLITVNTPQSEGIITVFDNTGKAVITKQIIGDATEVDVMSLKSGVYVIQIKTSDATVYTKFVKE